MDVRQRTEEIERLTLASWATFSDASRGRVRPEEQDPIRPVFQRDRDRIIHCKAFRRLKQKTQVFLSPEGDLYRTRLTHTLEVAQIARTIARALRLNEDLTEAISLAHDLGHTPFGHAGESALDKLCPEGFQHYMQSLRVVDKLEKDGRGLNLTWEVHPARRAPSPRTRCGLTDKEQIKNREEISSAHTCEEPPFDDDLFDEAIRVVETEATSESPPEKKQKKPRKARTSFATVERPDDLPEQLWQDWLELRKAKRAPLNTTTINTFRAEAQKAGISFEEAVSFSVANGYQGFKADWYRKNASTFTNDRPHQGYAGFGARNTAEIDYNYGLPVRGAVG